MTTRSRCAAARPAALERVAWLAAGLLLAGALSDHLRSAWHRVFDSAPLRDAIAWLGALLAFAGAGLSWQGVGALTSLLMVVVSLLRELRQWRPGHGPPK